MPEDVCTRSFIIIYLLRNPIHIFSPIVEQASVINFYDQQHAPGYLQRCSYSKTLVGSKRMGSIISKESKKLKESGKSIWLLETIVERTTSGTSSIFLFSPFTWRSTYQFSISMLLVYSFYLSYSSNRILDERREEGKKAKKGGGVAISSAGNKVLFVLQVRDCIWPPRCSHVTQPRLDRVNTLIDFKDEAKGMDAAGR